MFVVEMAGSRESALKAWATMREKGTIPKRKQAETEPVKKEKKSKKKAEEKTEQ